MNRRPAPVALARHVPLCVVRGAIAAGAAVVLALGLGLLVWAVTPASGSAWSVAQGALAVLGSANFITPVIGGITVTLPPLLLTLGSAALIASAAVRSDHTLTAADEAVGALIAGLVHSVVIVATVSALTPSGLTDPAQALAPIVFAAVVALGAAILRGTAWRKLLDTAPPALRAGVRAAAGVVAALLTAGALAVGVGLLLDLPTAIELSRQIAPSFGGGLGMMLLGIVLLPNAAVAGASYVGLVGFRFDGGIYSPLGSSGTELPAMPLFAAVPGAHALSPLALCWLLLPLGAAAWAGLRIRRQFADAADRAVAVAVAAAVAGIGSAVLPAIASGGLVGRRSLVLQVPVGPLAAVVAGMVLLIAGALCVLPDSGSSAARKAVRTRRAAAEAAVVLPAGGDVSVDDTVVGDASVDDTVDGDAGVGDVMDGDDSVDDIAGGDAVDGDASVDDAVDDTAGAGVVQDDTWNDGVYEDEVIDDGVSEDGVSEDGVSKDGVSDDGVSEDGAAVDQDGAAARTGTRPHPDGTPH